VIPSDTSLHQSYTFYIKATASAGGSSGYFGPYVMQTGCYAAIATYTDSPSLVTTRTISQNDLTNAYTFALPTVTDSTRSWCTAVSTVIQDSTSASRLTGQGS
jgi:hypothetical protein